MAYDDSKEPNSIIDDPNLLEIGEIYKQDFSFHVDQHRRLVTDFEENDEGEVVVFLSLIDLMMYRILRRNFLNASPVFVRSIFDGDIKNEIPEPHQKEEFLDPQRISDVFRVPQQYIDPIPNPHPYFQQFLPPHKHIVEIPHENLEIKWDNEKDNFLPITDDLGIISKSWYDDIDPPDKKR